MTDSFGRPGSDGSITVRYNQRTDSFYLPRRWFGRQEAVKVANQILAIAEDHE